MWCAKPMFKLCVNAQYLPSKERERENKKNEMREKSITVNAKSAPSYEMFNH